MTSTVITHIGELTTNDPARGGPLGILEDAALVIEGDTVAWVGSAVDAPAADTYVDAGGRAVLPGFVDSHSPPGVRRRPGARVRGPDDRRAVRRRRHPHHGRGDPGRVGRAARLPRRPPGAGDAAPGHHDRRDQERLRTDGPRRDPLAGGGPAVHRRDHVPRRARGAHRHGPGGVRRPGDRPDARRGRAVREVDRRVLRDRGLRRRPGPHDPRRRATPSACGDGCTPTSSVRARASGSPPSSA